MEGKAYLKILCISADSLDFTAYCRSSGTYARLTRDNPDYTVTVANLHKFGWDLLLQHDVVYVQRPHTRVQFEILKNASLCGRKTLIDFDDLYWDVPLCNPAWEFFTQEKNQDMVKACIRLADLVTVSTPKLEEAYAPYLKTGAKIKVIPNGYDSTVFSYHRGRLQKRQPLLWMRGSPTHDEDVRTFTPGILDALTKRPNYKFLCYGFHPWSITNSLPRDRWGYRKLPMLDYFYDTYKLNPAVMVVPLHHNDFNIAKSNVAAIEGAMTGSIVVAPSFLPEFDRLPGVIKYHDNESLSQALCQAMDLAGTKEGFEKIIELQKYIYQHLELGKINRLREEALNQLVHGKLDTPSVSSDNGGRSRDSIGDAPVKDEGSHPFSPPLFV